MKTLPSSFAFGLLLSLGIGSAALAQDFAVAISPTLTQGPVTNLTFTFTNVPQTVTFFQIAVVPPGTSGVAKLVPVYKYPPYDPSKGPSFTITLSDLNQAPGTSGPVPFGDPGVYAISVSSTLTGDIAGLTPVGPRSDGVYTVTVLPQTFGNITAAVVQSPSGVANATSAVVLTNNSGYNLSATVQVNYKYNPDVGARMPTSFQSVSSSKSYTITNGQPISTATLPVVIGAGSYSATVTIDNWVQGDGTNFPLSSTTSVNVDNLPAPIPVTAPTVTSCTIKSGSNRTLEILGGTSSFEIDTITITHPNASSDISPYVNPAPLQVAAPFATFMKDSSNAGGGASVPVGAFNAEVTITVPSVGTLGATQVTVHNASTGGGSSKTATCQ